MSESIGRIAIVGMAGRFPGANSIDQFWRNLCGGVESITRFADHELEDSFSAATRSTANFVKARPILEDVDRFDAEFFGMYAREAELTDPQQRIFLECCWEALESAGYDPAAYRGAIGVFAGSSINTYFLNNVCADRRTIEEFTSNYQVGSYPMLLGAGQDFLSTRVSYKLDLRGPSLTVSTACSTSLLAVAQAAQSLLLYQADMALAGGVSISFPQKRGYQHLEGGMVSADGTCRPFDADASGTIFGSGAGVVLLKRLEDALADGDHIYAVLLGSGVTNDGSSKVGFTAPSVAGQAAAIDMALAAAGVEARSIGYVECHGTATPLGDPIEIAGLTQAFGTHTDHLQFCAIGSVKGNVGHLDAAAGVTGLIKTALALEAKVLPPSLHYRKPNPQIDFAKTPFFVNDSLRAWPRGAHPLRAGVSAFGVGGTNVHVVLEEPPAATAMSAAGGGAELIVLSARSAAALADARRNLAANLAASLATNLATQSVPPMSEVGKHAAPALADVAYTLQVGRRGFDHRLAFVARDLDDAKSTLANESPTQVRTGSRPRDRAEVVFMFPGQGAQYPDMGRGLFERYPEFRRAMQECAAILEPLLPRDLLSLLYPSMDFADSKQRLMSTIAAQPALFSVEYALARLWMSWGVRPVAMIGHSIGEFVAAAVAGVMSLEDALRVVATRGRLMQELPGGAMLAVRLPEAELRALLPAELAIAAINGPALCVVSGPTRSVEAFEEVLGARGGVTRRLHTSHAFHSPMVEPVIEPLRRELETVRLSAPTIPYVSCVTGDWILPSQATSPDYWARHAREPVRFAEGIVKASASDSAVLLEVGPGNALTTLALQATRGRGIPVIASMQDAARERDDDDRLLDAVGQAWCEGVEPDWMAIHGTARRRVPLPTYPFERSRHWIDAPAMSPAAGGDAAAAAAAPATIAHEAQISATLGAAERSTTSGVRMAIAAILEDLSGEKPESIDAETTFLEMGYDSLFLTQVAQKLQSHMKVRITFRQLLGDFSSIPRLAAFVESQTSTPAAAGGGARAATPAAVAPMAVAPSAAATLMAATQAAATPDLARPEESQPSRFAVFAVAKNSSGGGTTQAQQAHIDELIARYTRRTAGSKRMTQMHRAALADPRVAAGFRTEWKEMVYPIVVRSSAGSKLHDVDGNEYIDLVNGFGQTAFGHAPPFVIDAVQAQLEQGFVIGPQAELAGKVAALFNELTGNERMTFCNTGSEAVMAAMRIARTVTGREKIVIFNGDYHGQFDEVLVKGVQRAGAPPRSMPVAPGIPSSSVANMIVLDYGTAQSLEWIRDHATELAAVIVEPVQSRHPALRPFDWLREVRRITAGSGTAFVMDEVVTGFRVHPGGIQAVAGIRADLVTYGKVVGGGLPIGILAGQAKFMDALDGGQWNYGDDSYPEVGVTFFAGTFVRHPLALASTWAVLNHLKAHGPALQETLNGKTAALVERLSALFASRGVRTRIETYSSWFYFHFHNEHPLAKLFFYHLRERGIHIQDGFPCFLTTAHSDADIERIYQAFAGSLEELQSVGILGGGDAGAAPGAAPAAAPSPSAVPLESAVPLTESQMEIWLSAQLSDAASCAFNESVSLKLQGPLDTAALREALERILARHDALRATFGATGEDMRFSPVTSLEYPVTDLTARSPRDAARAYAAILDADARSPFDLVRGPLFRAHLVKFAADSHALVITAHHIVCDGWSINVIVNELAEIYGSSCRGTAPALPVPLAFSAYARSQAGRPTAEIAKTERFWMEEFKQVPRPLDLPTDRPRPTEKTFNGASVCRRIDATLHQALKKTGARHGSTLFVTLLAAFQALMGRLANQDEVVVGVPTAGQSLLEDQILVGHCVNFLPLRGAWGADTKTAEFLAATAKRVLDAYEHQDYTFGTLVRKLALPRTAGRVPLAEIQFNLERLAERIEVADLEIDVEPNAKAHVNFDLFLNVIESAQGLRLDCDFNTDLFDAATILHWLDCYQALLQGIVDDASGLLCRAPCVPAADVALIAGSNDTAADFPRECTVHGLIETRVRATPLAVAAQFGDETLTYQALERRANQLANHLLGRIQGPRTAGILVGVSVDRSLDMLIALLAVLKAGCAYVPLDPMHPAARLRHILSEADVAALISDGSENATLVGPDIPVIDIRKEAGAIAQSPSSAPATPATPESLAYVIYTSGSTGLPKGVEIPHRAVVNLLSAMARKPGLAHSDVLLAVTTISFDIAVLELFLPLVVGARVVIAERDAVIDGFRLLRQLDAVQATAMQATPASWRLLLEAGFTPKPGFKMLCGGEALPRELADRLSASAGELWNMYGPTETTVWSSCVRVLPGNTPITVGGPIANTQFHVLDRNDQPLPVGVPGQLHIGGAGVARGYYKRPTLTAEKFPPIAIANPPSGSERLYRTGDLALWLPDGTLQILGRIDQQIKLRGFRIELGEIEAVLMAKANLAAVAVILREDVPGTPRIAAYYVEKADSAHTPETLRDLLAVDMPEYMLPSAWVRLDALPLSPNGKLDRAALPAPNAEDGATEEFVPASGAMESALTKIFAEVLHVPRVGATADLLKLGADSIQLFQITARANRAGIRITAKQLLMHRNAAALALSMGQEPNTGAATPTQTTLPSLSQFKRNRRIG